METKSRKPEKEIVGEINGLPVLRYTLSNNKGMQVQLINYGATITSIVTPDQAGNLTETAVGFDDWRKYTDSHPYLGSTIGRYANRIKGLTVTIDGVDYALDCNEGENCLHGGSDGWHKRVWESHILSNNAVRMAIDSPSGDQGLPGRIKACVDFRLTQTGDLHIEYTATTDVTTIYNPTNHVYFVLDDSPQVTHYYLEINADNYTPVDAQCIPTGRIASVEGTPFDFTKPKPIGQDINIEHTQLLIAKGYDHNFVINDYKPRSLQKVAKIWSPLSGKQITTYSLAPGIQLYTSNHLDLTCRDRYYGPQSAICLETQYFPDSPNNPDFPSALLRAGEVFTSWTTYQFGLY